MDDTIAILNAHNRSSSIADPPVMQKSQNDTVNISIISHDDSNTEEINVDERPVRILFLFLFYQNEPPFGQTGLTVCALTLSVREPNFQGLCKQFGSR